MGKQETGRKKVAERRGGEKARKMEKRMVENEKLVREIIKVVNQIGKISQRKKVKILEETIRKERQRKKREIRKEETTRKEKERKEMEIEIIRRKEEKEKRIRKIKKER